MRDMIVIGASAGGVEALLAIVADLPAGLPASVCVVLHQPPNSPTVLPRLLSRAGALPARHAEDGETLAPGHVYVAPPDLHLILENGRARLARGPHENRHRPAIDPLFRSAAHHYGPRAIGVVLTGTLDDGAAGLLAIRRSGGLAVVQDPSDALFSGMPRAALDATDVDHCLPLAEIGALLARLVNDPIPTKETAMGCHDDRLDFETRVAAADMAAIEDEGRPGVPSPFGCPECGGVLWQIENDQILRFRCRVGHAFGAESLLASQTDGLEAALWSALRALEEKASLTRRLEARARGQGQRGAAVRFAEQLEEAESHATAIRDVLTRARRPLATEDDPLPRAPQPSALSE